MNRALASLCAVLAALPSAAQVRPVLMPSYTLSGAGAPAAMVGGFAGAPGATLMGAPLAAPSLSASLLAAPSAPMPAAPAAAPAAASALSFAPKSAPASAAPRVAAQSLTAMAATPADAPALTDFTRGRQVFDGAALAGPAPERDPAAPAPRGDSLSFNGVSLPTRMYSDQTQISTHLIKAIDATKKTLDIAIYELAIREVHDALKRAKDRGVKVRVIMDQGHVYPEKPGQQRTPEVQAMIDDGFEMKTLRGGDAYGIMHNKVGLFDGTLLETGSFNWTRAADTMHFENALFDDSAARIASYQNYWNWMWSIARPVDLKNPPAKVELDAKGHTPPLAPAPQDSAKPVSYNGVSLPSESFTPHGTAALIAAAIDASKVSVDLANFSFTHADIVAALQRAKQRGIKIRLIFDVGQFQFLKEMQEMADLGFDVRVSAGRSGPRSVMHNKFGVFDGKLVETGSFNWTMNGELNNYENAVFLPFPDDVAGYAAYFERIWNQAHAPTAAERQPHPRDGGAPPAGGAGAGGSRGGRGGHGTHDAGADLLDEPLHPAGHNPFAF